MGKPGAKKLDKIVSVTPGDVHIIITPAGVPTPIPHPCTSIIKDEVATSVKVTGQPGAVKGSISKHTPPHIPQGGTFSKPPSNTGKIFTASSNVFYEGKAAAMLGDTAKMCADPVDSPVGKVLGTAATVLVGGGGSGSDADREAAGAAAMKAAAALCHKWIDANLPPGAARDQAHRQLCDTTGHPVDVATGKMFTSLELISLAGRLPLVLELDYSTARHLECGAFGHGWRHSLDRELHVHDEFIAYRDQHGRFVPFPPTEPGIESPNPAAGLTLLRDRDGFVVRSDDGRRDVFFAARARRPGEPYRLARVEDALGNAIEVSHTPSGLLDTVDMGNRVLTFVHDRAELVKEITLRTRTGARSVVARFEYHDRDLVRLVDAAGGVRAFTYDAHLMVRETDRNGFSFYFAYDRDQRCVVTWVDAGLLHRQLAYDAALRVTRVVDSRGATTLYHANAMGLVERVVDGKGHEERRRYDDSGHLVARVDENGDTWLYDHDDCGRLVAITDPEDQVVAIERDERGRIVQVTRDGSELTTRYDTRSGLPVRQTLDGSVFDYRWSDRGDLVEVRKNGIVERSFTYDIHGRLQSKTTRNKRTTAFEYDALGRLAVVRGDDGRAARLQSDPLGRLRRIVLPEGQEATIDRDPEGNVRSMTADDRSITYDDFRWHAHTRRAGNGATQALAYEYDNEFKLAALTTGRGECHRWTRDQHSRALAHHFPDGTSVRYERDPAGRVVGTSMRDGRVASYDYDAVGNVTRRLGPNGDETLLEYDALGRVTRATNGSAEVTVEFSTGGVIWSETFVHPDGPTDGYSRDESGALLVDDEPLLRYERDDDGRLTGIWCRYWARTLTVAMLDRETVISFPNGVREEASFDDRHRLVQQRVTGAGRDPVAGRAYSYDTAGALREIADHVRGARTYRYDQAGRLVAVGTPLATDEERYAFDAGENMSRGEAQWEFGAGDALVQAEGQRYEYDACGNRVRAVDASGLATSYAYDDQGQLVRVERPDGTRLEFHYDAFGRRVRKRVGDRETRFVWQESRVLMEIHGDGRRRLFIYYPGSFFPIGWVDDDGTHARSYFLHTDHMGRPQEATDESGALVWAPVYDAFGNVRSHVAAVVECPLRSVGQYCDEETGLYYNRHRYFDPVVARYLTPDPVGLDGGINPYQYCSNPLGWADPLGLMPRRPPLCWQPSQIPPIYDGSRALQVLSQAIFERDPARQAEMIQ